MAHSNARPIRSVAVLIGAFFLLGSNAKAQTDATHLGSAPLAVFAWRPTPEFQPATTLLSASGPELTELGLLEPEPADSISRASLPVAAPAEPPQDVQGVFPNRNWQAYAGYTFLRFYEVPGKTVNESGFNTSAAYYFRDWIAADGEIVAAFGSQAGAVSSSVLVAGGPRFRWSRQSGPELWVHALVGVSHFTPQTVYGSENALGYEVGGGVDIPSHHKRLAYRLQADLIGTRFFSTYQYSPKISAGVVFKF